MTLMKIMVPGVIANATKMAARLIIGKGFAVYIGTTDLGAY